MKTTLTDYAFYGAGHGAGVYQRFTNRQEALQHMQNEIKRLLPMGYSADWRTLHDKNNTLVVYCYNPSCRLANMPDRTFCLSSE